MGRIMTASALCAALLAAGPARAAFSKGQELTILALRSALLAGRSCPYRVDEGRLAAFLSRKGLRRADLEGGGYSQLLADDVAADEARYAADPGAACEQAWASFGPGSPMSGVLRAR